MQQSLLEELYDDDSSLMLDRETVGKILNIVDSTVYKLLRAGEIPGSVKVGGQWFVYKKGLRDFLEGKS
tara:strand:- start:445 stop:651 length:207 start_codon:yes stop_codon:yes gene_type:complete